MLSQQRHINIIMVLIAQSSRNQQEHDLQPCPIKIIMVLIALSSREPAGVCCHNNVVLILIMVLIAQSSREPAGT